MSTDELMNEVLCDVNVSHASFKCNDRGICNYVTITYADGSTWTLLRRQGNWRFAESGPPYDAATTTGMYDR